MTLWENWKARAAPKGHRAGLFLSPREPSLGPTQTLVVLPVGAGVTPPVPQRHAPFAPEHPNGRSQLNHCRLLQRPWPSTRGAGHHGGRGRSWAERGSRDIT